MMLSCLSHLYSLEDEIKKDIFEIELTRKESDLNKS
jgi:hypothetical protein